MPAQLCPGIAQVTVQQLVYGQEVINILHYSNGTTDAWVPADLLALANAVKTRWLTVSGSPSTQGISALQSNQLAVQKVTATDLTLNHGDQAVSTVTDGTGQSTGAPIEASLALVVTLRTGRSGRSYRGRIYIGGIAAGLIGTDANHVSTGGAANAALAAAFTIKGSTITTGSQPVVLSRQEDKVVRDFGIGTDILTYTCNTRLDNQRRRMPRT